MPKAIIVDCPLEIQRNSKTEGSNLPLTLNSHSALCCLSSLWPSRKGRKSRAGWDPWLRGLMGPEELLPVCRGGPIMTGRYSGGSFFLSKLPLQSGWGHCDVRALQPL